MPNEVHGPPDPTFFQLHPLPPKGQKPEMSTEELYNLAFKDKTSQLAGAHREISESEAANIHAQTGVKVRGHAHVMTTEGIRHIINRHNLNPMHGEKIVTKADLTDIHKILEAPDKIEYGGKADDGINDILVYWKHIDGHLRYLEEVRVGKKLLVPKTLYKLKAGPNQNVVRKNPPDPYP